MPVNQHLFHKKLGDEIKNRIYALAVFSISAMCFDVAAQSYPTKPIRMIVPFAAAQQYRLGCPACCKRIKQVLHSYHCGKSPRRQWNHWNRLTRQSGSRRLYRSCSEPVATHGVNSATVSKLPYDPVKDFEPISLAGGLAYVLMANNNLPASSVGELVSLARANPGKYSLAVSASTIQLIAELFKASAKIDIVLVPYKSQSSAYIDLANGDAALMIYTISASVPTSGPGERRPLPSPLRSDRHLCRRPQASQNPGIRMWKRFRGWDFSPRLILRKKS